RREEKSISEIRKAFADNKDDICAIIIEPIQSEGGDNHVRPEFLEQLRALADEHDCFLIYDEIQTGVGLTGKFWCHEHFSEKARPDILAFGKKMQVCGILAGTKVDEIETNVFNIPSRINSTWGGNLVDMVRCTKILEIIEEDDLLKNAQSTGNYLQDSLHRLSEKTDKISQVRGRGLMTSFDFPDQQMRDAFLKKGMENNMMFLGCGTHTIRFRPALIMEKSHIDAGIDVAERIIRDL
ncbi:MAG TPA: aminotransferase class III-fold pyridoxal phosphate-dependent enzyme, partial [Sphingobacteriaceae bacterium]